MLEHLVDNFIRYAAVYSQALKRYAGLYGKDVTFMKLPNNSTEDPYLVALGKNKVSFDYENPIIKKVPAKLIVDYSDFYKRYVTADFDALIFFSENAPVITAGDLVMYNQCKTDVIIYRIIEPVETYGDILFKCNMKMIQSKHVMNEKTSTTNSTDTNTGVII